MSWLSDHVHKNLILTNLLYMDVSQNCILPELLAFNQIREQSLLIWGAPVPELNPILEGPKIKCNTVIPIDHSLTGLELQLDLSMDIYWPKKGHVKLILWAAWHFVQKSSLFNEYTASLEFQTHGHHLLKKCFFLFHCISSIKIHDLVEMKEIYAIITLDDAGG